MNILEINSWPQYLRYIAKRNKGYGYRKMLNTFNEVAEISCYTWLFSESLLENYLVIPLFFILYSFVLDQILFTARISSSFNASLIKKIILIIIGGIAIAGDYYFEQVSKAEGFHFLRYIFYIKLVGIAIQSLIGLQIVEYYANRRIRPRFYLFIIISLTNLAIFFPLSYQFVGFKLFFAVTISFSLIKVLFELLYYSDVKKTISASRFVDEIFEKKAIQTQNSFGVIFILLTLLIMSYKISVIQHLSFMLTLFMLSFFYRITSRTYRFLWVDFKRLSQNLTMKIYLLRRSVFVVFICIVIMVVLANSMLGYLVGGAVFYLCLIELNLLYRQRMTLVGSVVLNTLLMGVLLTSRGDILLLVLACGNVFLLLMIKYYFPKDRFFTNFSLFFQKYKVISRFRFFGTSEDIREIAHYITPMNFKLRRIDKKTFLIISHKEKDTFEPYEDLFIARFGGVALLKSYEYHEFFEKFCKNQKKESLFTSKTFFGYWRKVSDSTLVRVLNFHNQKSLWQ